MGFNFLKLLKPDAHVARNGFDLSQKHVFSDKAGHGTPCLAVETIPNDKFVIDLAGLVRTQTFNTAAFVRGKFSYDFFFVPYVQLWHPFNQFIDQREDKHTTRQLGSRFCPNIQMATILTWIANEFSNYIHGGQYVQNIHGLPVCLDAVRLLDMLGYGDFRWLITLVNEEGDVSEQTVQSAIDAYDQYVNIFRLAAYQHIFYDWYRNKYYDVADNGGIAAFTATTYYKDYLEFFNFDDIDCSSFATSHIMVRQQISLTDQNANLSNRDYLRLGGLLTMRFTQYKKDLYTASLPSQQFGAVASVDLSASSLLFSPEGPSVSTGTNTRYTPQSIDNMPGFNAFISTPAVNAVAGTWSIPSAFDVLQLRKAQALQAWKQNAMRAGNQVNDNFRAHYGTESYYEDDNVVRYLGNFESRLDINTVTAQAASATSYKNHNVGDLAATGTSVIQGHKINFECKDFGVILCISTFIPDVDYNANMIDKCNRLFEPFDFYTEEYQNIGLDDVVVADFDYHEGVRNANVVVGKAPRYWQHKTALDKVHGEFNKGSLEHWVAPRVDQFLPNASGSRPLAALYVNPKFFDSVFGVRSDAYQETDYFLHNVYFDIKAIRPLSELGLPQF